MKVLKVRKEISLSIPRAKFWTGLFHGSIYYQGLGHQCMSMRSANERKEGKIKTVLSFQNQNQELKGNRQTAETEWI